MYNWYNFQPKILDSEKKPQKGSVGEAIVPLLIIISLFIWAI